ncbi:hypothetical protein ACFL2H_09205 [Planctomycetota bacterium]
MWHLTLKPSEASASITLLSADGKPAAERHLRLQYYDGHYGNLVVLDDKTSDDGIIQVEGLSRRPTSSAVGSYTLEVDGERIAFFNLAQNKTNNELTFKLMPRPGDLAPDLELVSIDTGKVTRLSDLTGKVVCLEV